MCPRPVLFRIASTNNAVENLATPFILTETAIETHAACSHSAEEHCPTAEVYFDQNFILSDRELERRLNYLVRKFCVQSIKKKQCQTKKLVVKPKQLQASEEEEERLCKPTEIDAPRSPSALKSLTSPTPGVKRSVRFVDSVGQNLEEVKLFRSETDYIDTHFEFGDDLLPSSRRRANTFPAPSSLATTLSVAERQKHLLVRLPSCSKQDVCKVVEAQNVCIESMSCTRMTVSGLIQVKNIAFEKQVRLRYTLNEWKTCTEIPCLFMCSNPINSRDTFCFSFCLPLDLPVGDCCEVCAHYLTAGEDFWDNNNGENYKLDCCAFSS